jgi:SAM-dependent methyltransferase
MFVRPAADLVTLTDVRGSRRILDVGTGSGIAAMAAAEAAPEAFVAGVDPSFGMLRAARGRGLTHVTVGAVPGLPFADGTFDRVIASFVLSHVPDRKAALADMVRVVRPGGRVGITAWGTNQNDYRELWDALCEARVGKQRMEDAMRAGIPWEDWLTDPVHVREALTAAGLRGVEVERREYDVHMTLAEFLSTREKSLNARFLQSALGPEGWQRFWQDTVAEFERRFAEQIVFTRDVLIGTGLLEGGESWPQPAFSQLLADANNLSAFAPASRVKCASQRDPGPSAKAA